MPTYTFKDREGNVYDVEAPIGTSEGKAFEKFQKALGQTGGGALPNSSMSYREEAKRLSPSESFGVNLGAGMSDVVNSVAQMLGAKTAGNFGKLTVGGKEIYPGIDYDPTDAGVADRRERDAISAQETEAGGLIQLLGQALPTVALPGTAAVKGVQLGAKTMSALAGAAGGATSSRLSDESRGLHTAGGAVVGAIAPAVFTLGSKLINLFRSGAHQSKAAKEIIEQLGGPDEAAKVVEQVKQYNPNAYTSDIPMTTAEITGNPVVAGIEAGTKTAREKANWTQFRGAQAEARADALRNITSGADELVARDAARETATTPMRQKALAMADKPPGEPNFFHAPVAERVASLRVDPKVKANSNARAFLKEVQEQLDSGISPEQLYEYRKIMLTKLHGPHVIGDPQSAMYKGADRAVYAVRDAIDDALNQASKGRWGKYLKTFQNKSGPVDDAAASAELREIFENQGARRIAGLEGRQVPLLEGPQLGKAIEKTNAGEFGDRFSDRTLRGLTALRDNLGMTESLKNLTSKASPGRGEGAGVLLLDAAEDAVVAPLSKTRRFISNFVNYGTNVQKAALADAMRDPAQFVKIVEKKIEEGKPLTASQDWVMRVIRLGNTMASDAVVNN